MVYELYYNDTLLAISEDQNELKKYRKYRWNYLPKDGFEVTTSSVVKEEYLVLAYELKKKHPLPLIDGYIIGKEFESLQRRLKDFETTICELGIIEFLQKEDIDSKFENAICTVAHKVKKLRTEDSKLYNKYIKKYYKSHPIHNMDFYRYISIRDLYLKMIELDEKYINIKTNA